MVKKIVGASLISSFLLMGAPVFASTSAPSAPAGAGTSVSAPLYGKATAKAAKKSMIKPKQPMAKKPGLSKKTTTKTPKAPAKKK